MGRRHADPGSREPQGGLDEPFPGQRARPAPELVEPGGDARNRARGGADEVVDELLAERDGELFEHRASRAARPSPGTVTKKSSTCASRLPASTRTA